MTAYILHRRLLTQDSQAYRGPLCGLRQRPVSPLVVRGPSLQQLRVDAAAVTAVLRPRQWRRRNKDLGRRRGQGNGMHSVGGEQYSYVSQGERMVRTVGAEVSTSSN